MFKFQIKGYLGTASNYCSTRPVDITVYADDMNSAIKKAEDALCNSISTLYRNVVIEEVEEW